MPNSYEPGLSHRHFVREYRTQPHRSSPSLNLKELRWIERRIEIHCANLKETRHMDVRKNCTISFMTFVSRHGGSRHQNTKRPTDSCLSKGDGRRPTDSAKRQCMGMIAFSMSLGQLARGGQQLLRVAHRRPRNPSRRCLVHTLGHQ